MLADPAMNVAIAACLMFASYAWIGMPLTSDILGSVERDQPAYRAGLHRGDRIISANGIALRSDTDTTHGPGDRLVEIVSASVDKPVRIVYERDGRIRRTTAYPVA